MKKKTFVLIFAVILLLSACSKTTAPEHAVVPDTSFLKSTLSPERQAAFNTALQSFGNVTSIPEPTVIATLVSGLTDEETALIQNDLIQFAEGNTPDMAFMSIPETYQIQAGESFFCIARRFDLDWQELLTLNGLGQNAVLPVGFELKLPQNTHWDTLQYSDRAILAHPTLYTVVEGDNIQKIACRFGDVFPEDIATLNKMSADTRLTVGSRLQVP